jgi:ATP-dependent DNA helicase RecG
MKPEDKDTAMDGFVRGETQLLVTTTVVEVGVDVPNATVMMIDGADRFGLAQLHQLRGRVGRSALPSSCHLVADPKSEAAWERLNVLARTNNGFEVAEADLTIRGPGELYGRRQAGLPGFRYGDLVRDGHILDTARQDAEALLSEDPSLCGHLSALLKEELARRMMASDAPVGEEAG